MPDHCYVALCFAVPVMRRDASVNRYNELDAVTVQGDVRIDLMLGALFAENPQMGPPCLLDIHSMLLGLLAVTGNKTSLLGMVYRPVYHQVTYIRRYYSDMSYNKHVVCSNKNRS